MKIAVPSRNDRIDEHFGQCQQYLIFTVSEDNKITARETLPSPQGCGCKSNIASVFQQMGVTVMLAGNMGSGAVNILNAHGVNVYRGCSGNADSVVEAFLKGRITDSGESCAQHQHHHHQSH